MTRSGTDLVRRLEDLSRSDVGLVVGKNASLGEMIAHLRGAGIAVPGGFATTDAAYWHFLEANDLKDRIAEAMGRLKSDRSNLADIGAEVRAMIVEGRMPGDLYEAIAGAYRRMGDDADVAVRSSATAKDLPEASFAGQQESFLGIRGEQALMTSVKRCFASLFTDREIAYREDHGFGQLDIALSVGVQRMVRADTAGSGVMFSIDTDTGFPRTVMIDAAWGLGETVVQGQVDPDEYVVFKPLLSEPGSLEGKALVPFIEKRRGNNAIKMVYAEDGEDADKPTRTVETTPEERQRFVLEGA